MRLTVVRVVIGIALPIVLSATLLWERYVREIPPDPLSDDISHFKYGSIGAEVDGYPFQVWRELPHLFPNKTPAGWETFGFLREAGADLPVGISVRKYGIERVGFNCATCHTARIEGSSQIILAAPSIELDIQRYLAFLVETASDPNFTADAVFASAEAQGRPFQWFDRLAYRYYVIPEIQNKLRDYFENDGAWMKSRAPHGPGRTDAGNPWRARFKMHPEKDDISGVVDMPAIWNQRIRRGAWLHWDGNNRSLAERNLSAALAGGASEDSLDHRSIKRVAAWLMDVQPPSYPFPIDGRLARRGRSVYKQELCGACHDPNGARYGHVTPNLEVDTDPDRMNLFSVELLTRFGSVGRGKSWQFRNYRKSNGYANTALDGIWLRAPYLHNGSVPTLADLLSPVERRPRVFLRGCSQVDRTRVGYRCDTGAKYDTALRGNGNFGHLYGTHLPDDDRIALLEFLKTL